MRLRAFLLAALLAFAPVAGAAQWEVVRSGAPPAVRPLIHDTEITGTNIGCITLARGETRRVGFRGHMIFCEEATTGEVRGALVNKRGNTLCIIAGFYNDEAAAYDLTICEEPVQLRRLD